MTTRVGVKKLESVKLIDLQNTQYLGLIKTIQHNTITFISGKAHMR